MKEGEREHGINSLRNIEGAIGLW